MSKLNNNCLFQNRESRFWIERRKKKKKDKVIGYQKSPMEGLRSEGEMDGPNDSGKSETEQTQVTVSFL